eukprot:PhF_6_TR43147/c0_g2_i3/m.66037
MTWHTHFLFNRRRFVLLCTTLFLTFVLFCSPSFLPKSVILSSSSSVVPRSFGDPAHRKTSPNQQSFFPVLPLTLAPPVEKPSQTLLLRNAVLTVFACTQPTALSGAHRLLDDMAIKLDDETLKSELITFLSLSFLQVKAKIANWNRQEVLLSIHNITIDEILIGVLVRCEVHQPQTFAPIFPVTTEAPGIEYMNIIRSRIYRLLSFHSNSNHALTINNVEALLYLWRGRESQLLRCLVEKYGPEPDFTNTTLPEPPGRENATFLSRVRIVKRVLRHHINRWQEQQKAPNEDLLKVYDRGARWLCDALTAIRRMIDDNSWKIPEDTVVSDDDDDPTTEGVFVPTWRRYGDEARLLGVYFPGCWSAEPANISRDAVLAAWKGKHVMMIGDSLTRYQYLN